LKSTKPSRLREALQSLPATLDETYERMLMQIAEGDRSDALTVLRWLAFEHRAHRSLTLNEIAEACIVDPSGDGVVEVDDRGGTEDILKILAGLVIAEDTRVRLAHFSVKEYLVSERILRAKLATSISRKAGSIDSLHRAA